METNAKSLNKVKCIHIVRIHILGIEPGKLGLEAELVGCFPASDVGSEKLVG